MKAIKKIVFYAVLGLIPVLMLVLLIFMIPGTTDDIFVRIFPVGFIYPAIVALIAFRKKTAGIWGLPLSETVWSLLVFAILFYMDTRPLEPGVMRCFPVSIIVVFFAPVLIIPTVIISGFYRFIVNKTLKNEQKGSL